METTTETTAGAVQAIAALATAGAHVQTATIACDDGNGGKLDVPVAYLPNADGGMEATSLLPMQDAGINHARRYRLEAAEGPDRREGTAQHQALSSFIAHVNRFKAENSAVWADAAGRKLTSVLDYHLAGATSAARWGKHRGVYPCPLSEAWFAWGGGKELSLDQEAFAALLDSRDRELTSGTLPNGRPAPDPASLITLAANLEVFSTATAKRIRDPKSGRLSISYSEEKGVSGDVIPPTSFLVLIPVFQDALPQPLEIRLRVEVKEAKASFGVQIHAAGDVLRGAFLGLCDRVTAETSLPLFVGSPE